MSCSNGWNFYYLNTEVTPNLVTVSVFLLLPKSLIPVHGNIRPASRLNSPAKPPQPPKIPNQAEQSAEQDATRSKQSFPKKVDWPRGTVFTVGHSTLTVADFIAILEMYDVDRVIDIRTIPRSRHNPQFNQSELAASLGAANLQYVHMPSLGGPRHPRKDSPNGGWRNKSFQGYADYMQTAEFSDALQSLIAMSRDQATVIMCAEAVPWRCHRSLVADALNVRGVPVVEILTAASWRMHEITAFAKVEGDRITYPPDQASLKL